MKEFRVLHICEYAANYRGNFIDSLESIETYHDNVENFFLFPCNAKNTMAKNWIGELNDPHKKAYIQESNMIKNFLLLAKILKKHKINRIVRHFSDPKIDLLVKILFKGKYVVRFFHGDYSMRKNLIKHKIYEFLWHKNKFVGVSDAVTEQVRKAHPNFSTFSIPNAIHFDRLNHQDPFERPEGISLLMMGWDFYGKGADLAIQAALPLQKKYNLTLQISCAANIEKNRELAFEILGEHADWIRFLPPTNNIGTYYRANDIFLSPSRHEAFGYANIEAVSCGNSIVLSKVGGQAQLKIEGAYWFESENVEDFTQKLEAAILERNTPEKIAQRKRVQEEVKHTYSLKEWSNKLVDLF